MVDWLVKDTRKNQRCSEKENLKLEAFRTVDHRGLPNHDNLSYQPLQNILYDVNYLWNSRELWSLGLEMIVDEGQVKSRNIRNGYHLFNAKKPVREGWTIYKVICCCLS